MSSTLSFILRMMPLESVQGRPTIKALHSMDQAGWPFQAVAAAEKDHPA
jgi:hypothetical protein